MTCRPGRAPWSSARASSATAWCITWRCSAGGTSSWWTRGRCRTRAARTGHASNFIFPIEYSRLMFELTRDSTEQYKALGVFTESGGIEVARTPERMQELQAPHHPGQGLGHPGRAPDPRRRAEARPLPGPVGHPRRRLLPHRRRRRLAARRDPDAGAGAGGGGADRRLRRRGARHHHRRRAGSPGSSPARARSRRTTW